MQQPYPVKLPREESDAVVLVSSFVGLVDIVLPVLDPPGERGSLGGKKPGFFTNCFRS